MVCSTQGEMFPDASIARQRTTVTPRGNWAGPSYSISGSRSATSNTWGEPVSTATGVEFTSTTMEGGGAIWGGWVSSTMIVCSRVELLTPPPSAGPASRAVQVTVWLPRGRKGGRGTVTCGVRLQASVARIDSRSALRRPRVDCPPGSWASSLKVAWPGLVNSSTGGVRSSTRTSCRSMLTTPVG